MSSAKRTLFAQDVELEAGVGYRQELVGMFLSFSLRKISISPTSVGSDMTGSKDLIPIKPFLAPGLRHIPKIDEVSSQYKNGFLVFLLQTGSLPSRPRPNPDNITTFGRLTYEMWNQTSPGELPLRGKVAIVTGSSRGIGAGLAFELARRGANVSRRSSCCTQNPSDSAP